MLEIGRYAPCSPQSTSMCVSKWLEGWQIRLEQCVPADLCLPCKVPGRDYFGGSKSVSSLLVAFAKLIMEVREAVSCISDALA